MRGVSSTPARHPSVITIVMRQGRVPCIERALLDAQQSLGGVARHRRALEGRRIVPPLQRRLMGETVA